MSKSSRKSSKKKRKREKQRLQKLQLQQRQGLVDVAPSSSTSSPPYLKQQHNETARREHTRPVSSSHIHNQSGIIDEHQPKFHGETKNHAFGSASSRRRALPMISFVFPRNDSSVEHQRYQFGNSTKREGDGAGRHIWSKGDPSILGSATTSTESFAENTTSIDEILYPSKRKTNEISVREMAIPAQPNAHKMKDGKKRKLEDELTKEALLNGDKPKQGENSLGLSPQSHHDMMQSPLSICVRSPYLSGVSVEEAVRDKHGLRPRSNSTDGELNLPQRGLCDEREVLQNYQWRQMVWKLPPRGFNNLGNTCFLNSTLQCLAYCPPFCQSIMAMHNDSASHSNGKNPGKRITLMLATLFRQLHGGPSSNQMFFQSAGSISPWSIVNAVPTLGSCGNRNSVKFRPGRQEDAHEFLVHLLDAMNDGELREAGINPHKSGWRDRLPVPRLDETTFIHRIFGGYLRSQVRCTDCGYKSNTYDPFLDLSLEISRNSCTSLLTAFQLFTRKETLDSENRWKCSGCKKRVCATKQLTVFRPPLTLCIQLKRFTYGGSLFGGFGGFGGHQGGKKISKPITFPVQMKLPLSDGRTCAYSLSGAVTHVGGSASSGHYTSYVRKPGRNGDDKWFYMDDSSVEPVTEREVIRRSDAYILLYCRKEVKLEFPVPPLRGSMTAEEAIEANRARARARSDSARDPSQMACSVMNASAPNAVAKGPELARVGEAEKKSDILTRNALASTGEFATQGVAMALSSNRELVEEEKPVFIGPLPLKPTPTGPLSLTAGIDVSKSQRTVSSVFSSQALQAVSTSIPSPADSGDESSSTSSSSSLSGGSLNQSTPVPTASSSQHQKSSLALVDSKPAAKSSANKKPQQGVDRISVDRGENGKVEVMMGSRFKNKKAWKPVEATSSKGDEYHLLGNAAVDRWDKEEAVEKEEVALQNRAAIADGIQRADMQRKRKMHLDRHDAMLDQGKTKKVKKKDESLLLPKTPQSLQFQRIQRDMQRMNHGRAKGYVIRSNNSSSKTKVQQWRKGRF